MHMHSIFSILFNLSIPQNSFNLAVLAMLHNPTGIPNVSVIAGGDCVVE
jgi:hypothetical protein